MTNTLQQYVKLQATLVQEKKDLETRLADIDKALAGKLKPSKKKAAKKVTKKKRRKMSAATIKKMKAAAKKRWAAKKKK